MGRTSDFGRYIKSLYPGEFDEYTDKQVGKIVKEKKPELFAAYQKSIPSAPLHPLTRQVLDLQNEKTEGWATVSRLYTKRSEASTELINQNSRRAVALNDLRATTEMGPRATDHMIREQPKRLKQQSRAVDDMYKDGRRLYKDEQAKSKTKRKVEKAARAKGLDYESHILHTQNELATDVEVDKTKRISGIKTEEQRQMKQIELEAHREQTRIDVIAALVARNPEQYEVQMFTQQLFGYYDQKERLLLEADTQANRKKIRRLDKNIRKLEKAIDERAEGLIQGNSRPELRGLEEKE